jgi:lysylphosphatidylglycerol synthetase-like protein (DUF2156 family)
MTETKRRASLRRPLRKSVAILYATLGSAIAGGVLFSAEALVRRAMDRSLIEAAGELLLGLLFYTVVSALVAGVLAAIAVSVLYAAVAPERHIVVTHALIGLVLGALVVILLDMFLVMTFASKDSAKNLIFTSQGMVDLALGGLIGAVGGATGGYYAERDARHWYGGQRG